MMLVDTLLTANRKHPGRLAFDDGIKPLSYRRLTQVSAVLRGVVRASTNAQRVGIMLPCCSIFPAALHGVLWANRVAVPINFLLNPAELEHVVKDAGIDLILTISHFRSLAEALPARAIYLDEFPLKRKVLLQMLLPLPAVPSVDENDTAVVLYTSGTLAQPKGVELTYGNLHSNCLDTVMSLGMDAKQSFLALLPPFHVFGLTATVLIPILLGSTVYMIARFNPAVVRRTIAQKRPTIVLAIPSMYAALLRSKSATRDGWSSVDLAISGGEPLPEKVRLGYEERFGVLLCEGYGLTETSPIVAVSTPDARKVGSVGRPIRNVQARFVGAVGDDAPTNADGELWVKSPGVMKGYLGRAEETAAAITPEGWFKTGDIARQDEDGYVFITGRKKEMLIIGGENVFPREIESVLEEHESVLQAAVVGVPDETRGEAAVAFVLCKEGAGVKDAELRSFARKSLAGFKVPKQIYIKDDLPKSPTGKILKRQLRDLL